MNDVLLKSDSNCLRCVIVIVLTLICRLTLFKTINTQLITVSCLLMWDLSCLYSHWKLFLSLLDRDRECRLILIKFDRDHECRLIFIKFDKESECRLISIKLNRESECRLIFVKFDREMNVSFKQYYCACVLFVSP